MIPTAPAAPAAPVAPVAPAASNSTDAVSQASSMLDRRVFKYGCLPPHNPKPVIDQMYLAHRYRIQLVLIERSRRNAVRSLLPEDRKAWSQVMRQSDVAEKIAFINERAGELRRGARDLCGVYWGTYQLIEAADQACRKDLPLTEDPRWPPWTGEGSVSVQLQGGLEKDGLSDDTQIQVIASNHGKKDEFVTLRMRIGSQGRRPIWAEWPCRIHRPLPKGTVIKRVTVHRTLAGARTSNPKSGRREHWEVQFIIEQPLAQPTHGAEVVGVDLGWRRVDNELRACAFADDYGNSGDLRLSEHLIGGFKRVDSLRKTRDDMRNRALGFVIALRRDETTPQWFKKETEHAHAWRNPKRIPVLLFKWQQNRWPGDDEAFAWIYYWLERDRHLWQWESDQRRHNQNKKRKLYEEFAARLAEKYEILVLEEFDLRTFSRKPAKDAFVGPDGRKESQQEEKARSWRHLAGTCELRLVLENAFLTRGGSCCRVPAMDTTRTCGDCGLIVRRDFAGSVTWTCDCGAVHDQDINAGTNLCERFCALEKTGTARIRKAGKLKEEMESKFVRAKKKKAEKIAAREAVPNAVE